MPDGDGLGAEIALYHYLVRLGKDARIINPDQLPPRYRFLDPAGTIEIAGSLRTPFNGADLAIVVDTGDYRRLGPLWNQLKSSCSTVIFLDHHPRLPDESPPAPVNGDGAEVYDVIDERSSSIGELLYRLFHVAHDVLDPVNPSFRLSPEIALGLYVSIITDTNSFRYSKTTALSHRIAADLIDYGLQPELIYQNIYSTKSVDHLRLIGTALSGVCQSEDGSVAWVEIEKGLRHKHKASGDDTQNIVNFMLLLQDPEVLVMLREEDDGRIKASLKSKGQIIVNRIAAEFGGGGHDFAAGFNAKGTMAEVRVKLLERLREEMRARR
jgi:phosphoesterase RecJ-like protein